MYAMTLHSLSASLLEGRLCHVEETFIASMFSSLEQWAIITPPLIVTFWHKIDQNYDDLDTSYTMQWLLSAVLWGIVTNFSRVGSMWLSNVIVCEIDCYFYMPLCQQGLSLHTPPPGMGHSKLWEERKWTNQTDSRLISSRFSFLKACFKVIVAWDTVISERMVPSIKYFGKNSYCTLYKRLWEVLKAREPFSLP